MQFHPLRGAIVATLLSISATAMSQETPLRITGGEGIFAAGDKLESLWEKGGFTEGVAAGPDGGMYFSDFAQPFESGPARVMKFSPESGEVSVHCPDSGMGNGLMFTRDGRLLGCCASPMGGHRALVEFLNDGKVKLVAGKFEGKRFNSPNDIVIDRKGRVYFSDPKYVGPEKMELDGFYVYRRDPDGSLHIATKAITKPNGVALSPDQKTLYVAETDNGSAEADRQPGKPGRMTLNALPVAADGTLGAPQVIVNFGNQLGVDGMTVDRQGRIFAAVRSADRHGIYVFTPNGKELGYAQTPSLPTNCCFGRGAESSRLYITAGGGLYRLQTQTKGYHPALD
ncbi:MAG: SMP-30/gluconolactonase/LRE family protein [Planctomycetales bacterium]|nr:SMP-30/gluconolactonase/LRE family protein [Planctomycetales bacterium]